MGVDTGIQGERADRIAGIEGIKAKKYDLKNTSKQEAVKLLGEADTVEKVFETDFFISMDSKKKQRNIASENHRKVTLKISFPTHQIGNLRQFFNANNPNILADAREILDGAVYGFSTNYTIETPRPDGSLHKEHPNVDAYHHFINKIILNETYYYVQFTVEELKSKEGQVHSGRIICAEILEQKNRQEEPTDRGISRDEGPKPVSNINIIEFWNSVKRKVSKIADEQDKNSAGRQVIRARALGFCMGVRRAVDLALKAAGEEGPVFTLGPLIHNPQALEALKRKGISILDDNALPENLAGARVVIRAHGIPPGLEEALRGLGAAVIDATCPRVKASQKKAASLAGRGYRIFLAGAKDHGEIIGIQGYAPDCIIVANAGEAEEAASALKRREGDAKTALLAQTTLSPEEYAAIAEAVSCFFPDLLVEDTICLATRERQEALRELCSRVDAVVVAGGKNSANTARLLAIARAAGKPSVLAETPGDIPPEFAVFPNIGLSAGASTPEDLICDIEKTLLCRA